MNDRYPECQICLEKRELSNTSFICFQCGLMCCFVCSAPNKALINNSCPQCRTKVKTTLTEMITKFDNLLKMESSAISGYLVAQYFMGTFFIKGQGTVKNANLSYQWFKIAADSGHVSSKKMIAFFYEKGVVVDMDIKEAKRWYLEAAGEGDSDAQFRLAQYFNEEKRFKDAKKWLKAASSIGCAKSKYMLGFYYENGLGNWWNKRKKNKAFKIYKSTAFEQIYLKPIGETSYASRNTLHTNTIEPYIMEF